MRETDLERLEKVKASAIKMITEKGFHGATISKIAKEADVSDGYLYRHYANKLELVKSIFIENMDLFFNIIFTLIETKDNVREILRDSFVFWNTMATNSPEVLTFVFIMDHDYNFEMPVIVKDNFAKLGQKLWAKGIQTGEINNKITAEETMAVVFGFPVKMIELRRKGIFSSEPLSDEDVINATSLCMNALR